MTAENGTNLLHNLHRWASRQDENFTSEAFAHLLGRLLAKEPAAGVDILSFLTRGHLVVPEAKARQVEISTQVTTDHGRPDIEIRIADHLVYVEVKLDAGLGWKQLERYWTALSRADCPDRTLVLLTRHPVEDGEDVPREVVRRRWYEVADRLSECARDDALGDAEAVWLVEQFVTFLRLRGMTMERVGWELDAGIRSYVNLMEMIREALVGGGESAPFKSTMEYAGFNVLGSKAWVGIMYDQPASVLLQTNGVAVDPQLADGVGRGIIDDDPWHKGKLRWLDALKLDSEDVHFFARSRASQMQIIEEFVSEGLSTVRMLIEKELQDG